VTEIVPSGQMTDLRRFVDRSYALDGNPASTRCAAIASWLPGQLPGHDMRNIGWGLLLIAATITPNADRSGPGSMVTTGARAILLNAGTAGGALIDSGSPGPAAEPSPDVGQDLSVLRPKMADLVRDLSGRLPPGSMDLTEVARESPDTLREIFPDVDLAGTGWAALAAGMFLGREVLDAHDKVTRGLIRRRAGEQRRRWRNGAFAAVLTLGSIGDYLIGQS
jgi:hypothetical protein